MRADDDWRPIGADTATLKVRRADMLLAAIEHNLTWDETRRMMFTKFLIARGVVSDDDAVLVRPVRKFDSC